MENFRNLYSDGQIINYEEGDQSLERFPTFFPDTAGDINHIVKEDDNLVNLSHVYYKDSRLWWKIADKNNLDDIFNLELGSQIIIPNIN